MKRSAKNRLAKKPFGGSGIPLPPVRFNPVLANKGLSQGVNPLINSGCVLCFRLRTGCFVLSGIEPRCDLKALNAPISSIAFYGNSSALRDEIWRCGLNGLERFWVGEGLTGRET